MANGKELRRQKRKPINVPIQYKGRRKKVEALTHNLSLGGMFVATKEPLKLNQNIFFTLKAKEKPVSFNLEGEVIWNNGRGCTKNRKDLPQGMGVRFKNSRVLNKNAIKSFVDFIEESTFSICV